MLLAHGETGKRWDRNPSPSSPGHPAVNSSLCEECPPQVTPLFLACRFYDKEAALLLLSRGADPNNAPRAKPVRPHWLCLAGAWLVRTPLYYAAIRGWVGVCRSLLSKGARQDIDTGGENLVDIIIIIIIVVNNCSRYYHHRQQQPHHDKSSPSS